MPLMTICVQTFAKTRSDVKSLLLSALRVKSKQKDEVVVLTEKRSDFVNDFHHDLALPKLTSQILSKNSMI